MSTAAILVLQGGGALGAYECGAYKALVPHLKEQDQDLKIVAGTSIGAFNASIIALNYDEEDHGAGTLQSVWEEDLAVPSISFPHPLPLSEESKRWNAVWTSLLYGHPRLFTPHLWGWHLFPPVYWSLLTHLYDTQAMKQTVEKCFRSAPGPHDASYGPRTAAPRLIVTAVEIDEGRGVAFDSFKQAITPEHVVASGSLPPWFPAKTIEGKRYWDGGLWANTPLRDVLYVLEEDDYSLAEKVGAYQQVYIVDVFPRRSPPPRTMWEVLSRIDEITYADKTRYYAVWDLMNWYAKSAKRALRHIELVPRLYELSETLPPSELKELIEKEHEEHAKLSGEKELSEEKEEYGGIQQKHIDLRITRIERSPLPYEAISRDIDFSPGRIKALIGQGYEDAKETLEKEGKGGP